MLRCMAALAMCLLLASCQDAAAPPTPPGDAPRWVKQHAPRAKVALVFVHGIFGDAQATWSRPGGSSMFQYLERHPQLGPRVDMFTFGYASNALAAGSLDIQQAADKLHEHLKYHGLLNYPSIVFVAHSMGGLVVMRELLTHRDLMAHVPVLAFYATPQEGAQIAAIARHVAHNPALEQLLPADKNGYLSTLDSEWKSLPAAQRPVIRCAYETKPYQGVMIVQWSSGTRFCDGASTPIAENHADIVKPDRAEHDALVFLTNVLNDYVLERTLEAKLETPDFIRSGQEWIYPLANPFGKQGARLVNAGRGKLRYTVSQVDPALYIWPAETPRTIAPESTEQLTFALAFGARAAEYRFVLQPDPGEAQTITVRVANPQAMLRAQTRLAQQVSRDIKHLLAAPKPDRQWGGASDPGHAKDAMLAAARHAVQAENASLPEAMQWLMVADVMHAANWPELSTRALHKAGTLAPPGAAQLPGVQRLAAANAVLVEHPQQWLSAPIHTDAQGSTWKELSQLLQQYAALRPLGLRLAGKIEWLAGDQPAAQRSFSAARRAAAERVDSNTSSAATPQR